MTKYKARIEFLLEIEADNIDVAVRMARNAAPTHISCSYFGEEGNGSAAYGGMFAIKVEAVKGEQK